MKGSNCETGECAVGAVSGTVLSFEMGLLRALHDRQEQPAPGVQRAAVDRIHWYFSLTPADRRAYAEEIATKHLRRADDPALGNWAKVFFNNKGVAAKATEVCMNYPRGDMSVWDWPVAR